MKKTVLSFITLILLNTLTVAAVANQTKSRRAAEEHHFTMQADRSFKGLEIGGSLLYFQSGISSDLVQYAVLEPTPNPNGTEYDFDTISVDSEYEVGFDVFARYYFATGQDLTVRYTHFDSASDDGMVCNNGIYNECVTYPSDEEFTGG